MMGIGFGELVIIAVVLIIAVGPDRMPTFLKAVGKGLREFRRATRELRNTVGIDDLLRDDDLRRPLASGTTKREPKKPYELTDADRKAELPEDGADVAHALLHPEAARAHRPPLPTVPGPVVEKKPTATEAPAPSPSPTPAPSPTPDADPSKGAN